MVQVVSTVVTWVIGIPLVIVVSQLGLKSSCAVHIGECACPDSNQLVCCVRRLQFCTSEFVCSLSVQR